jgi:hypothetical protein
MIVGSYGASRQMPASICALLLTPGALRLFAAPQATTAAPQPAAAPDTSKAKSPEQLDSLVAPIALYPDPLLAQVLAASTYPLEIVQANQWPNQNSNHSLNHKEKPGC